MEELLISLDVAWKKFLGLYVSFVIFLLMYWTYVQKALFKCKMLLLNKL